MYGYFKTTISDKKMAKVMYALLKTRSKLVNSFGTGLLDNYCRRQCSGFSVDVVVEVDDHKVALFENLAGVKLKTSEGFQGIMMPNDSNVSDLDIPIGDV